MISYLCVALILLIYFEFLGQCINHFLNTKNLAFNYVIGFFFVLAFGYAATSILTSINCKFFLVLIINTLLLLIGLVIIIVYRKHIKIRFKTYELFFLLFSVAILFYYTYNTTLGDLHGFDSVHYLNLVTGPINSKTGLFGFDIRYGYDGKEMAVYPQYSFTTYYTFVSTILFYIKNIFNLANKTFFYNTAFIWVFQLIFHFSFVSIAINAIKAFNIKFKPFIISIFIFFTFYLGKIYFYNVYGFFGNSLRIIATSYMSLYTLLFFKDKKKNYLYLIGFSLVAGCSFTSSFLFFVYLFLFAFVLVAADLYEYIFKWVSIVIFFPSINLISMLFWYFPIQKCILISLFISLFLYLLNNIFIKVINFKYCKQIIVVLLSICMLYMSYKLTGNILDFKAFFNNNSERADMTLNYFSLNSNVEIKLTTLLCLLLYSVVFRKEKIAMISWILVISLFNPFCCSYFNSINAVYYRSYDLIINPLLIAYYYYSLFNKIENKKFKYLISFAIILIFAVRVDYLHPSYYHTSFIPTNSDYDNVSKMSNTEKDIIIELNNCIDKYEIKNPRIVSPNILTFSSIGRGNYLFCREFKFEDITNEDLLQVIKICYPVSYFGEVEFPDADYRNLSKYLDKGDVDILVLSKRLDIYDGEKKVFYPLRNVVEWDGVHPEYENEEYVLYVFEK